jgi:hypothetical protein
MKAPRSILFFSVEVSNHLCSYPGSVLTRLNKLVTSDQKIELVIAKGLRTDLDTSALLSMKAVSSLINLNAEMITYRTSYNARLRELRYASFHFNQAIARLNLCARKNRPG